MALNKLILITSLALNLLAGTYFSYKIVNYFNPSDKSPKNWYSTSRLSHFNALQLSESDTVFLGASIVQYAEWNELLPDRSIKNRAIAGTKVQDVNLLLPSILATKPKNIFLMVGYNDLSHNDHYAEFIASYRSIINTTSQQHETQLYIMSITPVRQNYSSQPNINTIINTANNEIKNLCKKPRCHYIDIHKLLIDTSGQLDSQYTVDGIHLKGTAYQIISNKLNNYLYNK